MSATPDGRGDGPSTPFKGARPSCTAPATSRADIASNLELGDLANVDAELFEVFDLEERR